MFMWVSRARLLIATLWAGSLWTVGYIVAPTLFMRLDDRMLAGTIAGSLFRIEAWLSVVCAAFLIGLLQLQPVPDAAARKRLRFAILSMLACTLVGYFALHPWMAGLREAAGPTGIAASADRTIFGILHGVSSGFYLIQSLLGMLLVVRVGNIADRPDERSASAAR